MGLLSSLLGIDDENNKEDNSDSILNLFGLDDNQKKEVKEGNYDAWNFEEEDLEEDDYHYEDED